MKTQKQTLSGSLEERLWYFAMRKGETMAVERLIAVGVDTNAKNPKDEGNTALHTACYNGCVDIAKLLLDNGADIEARNRSGLTALHWSHSQGEVTQLLIEYGANVNDVANNHALTPLHRAGTAEVAKILIDAGADIEVTDGDDWTPLFHACKRGYFEIATILLEGGCDINRIAGRGFCWTVLHEACCEDDPAMAKFLIDKNADLFICDSDGTTPFQYILQNEAPEFKGLVDHVKDKYPEEYMKYYINSSRGLK